MRRFKVLLKTQQRTALQKLEIGRYHQSEIKEPVYK